MTQKPQAAFIVARLENGMIAATSRAADRGEAGRIGLPGGKVDPDETPRQAARREAGEEGWLVANRNLAISPFHRAEVEGFDVFWFMAHEPVKLEDYKEKPRGITPIEASVEEIAASGYGNDLAMQDWLARNFPPDLSTI